VILGFVIVALAAYFYGASKSDEQIGIKNERINFLNDQLTAYKDRLQGATPDQAAQQIALLRDSLIQYEKKFDELFPSKARTLSSREIESLINKKDDISKIGVPIPIFYGLVGDSADYATNFADFLYHRRFRFLDQCQQRAKRMNAEF
jgi:hypothetical protein